LNIFNHIVNALHTIFMLYLSEMCLVCFHFFVKLHQRDPQSSHVIAWDFASLLSRYRVFFSFKLYEFNFFRCLFFFKLIQKQSFENLLVITFVASWVVGCPKAQRCIMIRKSFWMRNLKVLIIVIYWWIVLIWLLFASFLVFYSLFCILLFRFCFDLPSEYFQLHMGLPTNIVSKPFKFWKCANMII